ncbi:phosphonatase-like hydrolase [Amycolatopsis endophytica]|uniref:Phosphonatase-like hydrolase n=1 Tax=Amycolatopsis endophytica TaxID=860233 RepID=A0A853BEQ2_9PSEU|nr:phosphonatase-like hydrolase [Amycolatopsis endophytica]NYI93234.1 phosphonatase-like hydrolase [Amycolatopsis endophytica]
MKPELVVLDMAGTTAADDGLVEQSFITAITTVGVPSERHPEMLRYVRETMGQSKITVFRALLGEESSARRADDEFRRVYEGLVHSGRCVPLPGAEDTVRRLRADGIKVAFTTGFAAGTQHAILDALGWQDLADLALAPGPGVRGRPYPDLVLTAALRLGVTDVRAIAVAGDTPSDVLAAARAGASVAAGVLTGAGTVDDLRAAGATHVLGSVAELPAAVQG